MFRLIKLGLKLTVFNTIYCLFLVIVGLVAVIAFILLRSFAWVLDSEMLDMTSGLLSVAILCVVANFMPEKDEDFGEDFEDWSPPPLPSPRRFPPTKAELFS